MKKIDIFNKFSLKVKSNAVIAKIAFPFLVAFLIAFPRLTLTHSVRQG